MISLGFWSTSKVIGVGVIYIGDRSVKDSTKSNSCDGISGKMQTANVSPQQVNKIFWEKHPEHRNKSINADNKDLTREWCQIAESLSKK